MTDPGPAVVLSPWTPHLPGRPSPITMEDEMTTVAAYVRFEETLTAHAWKTFAKNWNVEQHSDEITAVFGHVHVEVTRHEDAEGPLDISEIKIFSEDQTYSHSVAAMAVDLWIGTPSWMSADVEVRPFVEVD